MADLLTRVQRELDERLAELRPLVEEARQLEQALEALTPDADDAPRPSRRYHQRSPVTEVAPATPPAAVAEPEPAVQSAPEPAVEAASESAAGSSSRSGTRVRSGARDRSGPTLRSTPTPGQPRRKVATRDAETDEAAETARRAERDAAERRRRALAIITENPGTTAGTLALLLDTSVATMGSLLKRLERDGVIERAERGYASRKQAPRATAEPTGEG